MNTNQSPEQNTTSFFKVNNGQFYKTFIYPSLDPAKSEIRLLKIDARGVNSHELISGISLAAPLKYTALSYVCGSPANPIPINVNGHSFNAFANLAAAIDEVRQCWKLSLGGKELLLWTDQICINQNDDNERSHQVTIMREIYNCADQTIARLPATVSISYRFETWRHCKTWFENQLSRLVLSKYPDEKPRTNCFPEFQPQAKNEGFIRDVLSSLLDLYLVAGSKWWTRAWIFQEFIASPNFYFMWSPFLVPWQDIQSLWSLYYQRDSLLESWLRHAKEAIQAQEPFWTLKLQREGLQNFCDQNCTYCGTPDFFQYDILECEHVELCDICDCSSQAKPLSDLVVRKINALRHKFNKHHSGFPGLENTLRTKENILYSPLQLGTFLNQFRSRKTSEPRDRVYAYIGLLESIFSLVPDYRKSLNSVFVETAQEILIHSENLVILDETAETDRRSSQNDPLPSWVPIWTTIDWSDPINKPRMDPFLFGDVSMAKAEVRFLSNVEGRKGYALEAKGIMIDVIDNIDRKEKLTLCIGSIPGVAFCSSAYAQCEDELWSLYGAKKLYLFRRQGKFVILISQAYVANGFEILRSRRAEYPTTRILIN
jgi:hypothetical protein